jgi:2-polyprenyl-3-methyl-5-hydroxy-6-metoxy-1,4-benzoquinol methylase
VPRSAAEAAASPAGEPLAGTSTAGPACPCCGARERALAFVKWGYRILRCRGCGLGTAEVAAGFEPLALYDERYFRGGRRDGYADYPASEPVLRAQFRHMLRDLRRHVPAGGRLLEVGCAYGFFLEEARAHWRCEGLEVATAAVAFCRARGLDVRQATLEQVAREQPGAYDAVVLLDVLEHLADPAGALGDAAALLRPGGVLFLVTLDWASPLARVMGRRWRLMTPPQHLFYFTAANLRQLLDRHGLETLRCTRPWKLVPLGLALFQLLRSSRLQQRLPGWLFRLGLPVNLFDTVQVVARKR